ncbi:MAG: LOG family protein [Desulfobulbaceae bacterium]|nr:LOG family protein [Desulfobulbaceae bacterium]
MTHSRLKSIAEIKKAEQRQTFRLEDFITAITRLKQARLIFEQQLQRKEKFDLVAHFRIAIFGSARTEKNSSEFQFVSALTKAIVLARQIGVVTGGGPGIMQSANEGLEKARAARAKNGEETHADNIGILISLPFESGNGITHITTKHENFSTRLQAFVSQIKGAYCAQGGMGTALEMLYLLQLKQVKHIESDFPILAHPMWKEFMEVLNKILYYDRLEQGGVPLISEADLQLVKFTDNIEDIVNTFAGHYDLWQKDIRSKIDIIYDPHTIEDPSLYEFSQSVDAKPMMAPKPGHLPE